MFGNKKSEHYGAVIDFGSASVGACLFKISHSEKIESKKQCQIIWSVRKQINFGDNVNLKTFLAQITQTSEEIISLIKKQPIKPENITCFLSSPFFISQTKTISYNQKDSISINQKHIDNLIKQSTDTFLSKIGPLYPDLINDKNIILENYLLKSRLNGYEVSNPIKKKASSIELTHYISLSSAEIINRLKNTVRQINPKADLNFVSFNYAYASVFSLLFAKKQSGILIDVSGELTDLILVADKHIRSHLSFPIGRNSIIKKAKNDLNYNQSGAESALSMHANKESTANFSKELLEKLKPIQSEWDEKLRASMEILMKNTPLPENLYLLVDNSVSKIFAEWIQTADYSTYTLSNKNLSVDIINQDIFRSKLSCQSEDGLDPFLSLETLFVKELL